MITLHPKVVFPLGISVLSKFPLFLCPLEMSFLLLENECIHPWIPRFSKCLYTSQHGGLSGLKSYRLYESIV